MQAANWTVITTPPARSERWAVWVSARRSFATPLLAAAMAVIAFAIPSLERYSGIQMFLVGFLAATSFFIWERRGLRSTSGGAPFSLARARP